MAKYSTFKYGAEKYGVGLTTGNLLWSFVVKWDNVEWSPNEAHRRMTGLTVKRGRDSLLASGGKGLQSFRPGEAISILDNEDRRFDPFNVDSPLYPNVSPGKFCRLAVRDDSTDTDYGIMRGIIDDIQPVKEGNKEQVRIVIKDGLQWLRDRIINLGQQTTIAKHSVFDLIIGYDGIAGKVDWPVDEWPITRTTDTTEQAFWWGWNQGAYQAFEEWNKAEWAVIFHDRDGNITWRPRQYDYERVITIGQDEILRDIGRPQPWEVVRNIVRVYSSPKILDVVGAILWQLQTVPALADGDTFFIEPIFKYSDWLPCGANVVFAFTVNAQADGGGADLSAGCSLVYDTQIGEGARLWLTNNSGSDGYIIEFKATGDAIYPPSIDIREEEDATSKTAYGARSMTIDSRWIEDTEFAQTQAVWLLSQLKDPRMMPIIQMEDQLVNQYTPDLYDKMILKVPTLSISHTFRIGHIEHQWLSENGQSVHTTMRLEPYLVSSIDAREEISHGCLLTRSAAKTIAHSTVTAIDWDEQLHDTDAFHAGSNLSIVIPVGLTGYYRLWGEVYWEGDAVGYRTLILWRTTGDEKELGQNTTPPKGASNFTQRVEVTRYLEAGEAIRLYVIQTSGGNLDILNSNTPYTPLFGAEFLGA